MLVAWGGQLGTHKPLTFFVDMGWVVQGTDSMSRICNVSRLARRGFPDRAAEELSKVKWSESDPLAPRLYKWAEGEIAHARNQEEEAVQRFREAAPELGEPESAAVGWWTGFLVHRVGRALRELERYAEAQSWLIRFEQEQGIWIDINSFVPKRRALWDLALCRDAQGDSERAIEYLERFLRYWHTPDPYYPEIQEALDMYQGIFGRPYDPHVAEEGR